MLASGSRSLSLVRGDRVALVMSNCAEFIEIMRASWAAGLLLPVWHYV
jgi:acyl-CoA synthetase (AMP-forming)/AMP-acid ligase II